jgi:hypothetical protein
LSEIIIIYSKELTSSNFKANQKNNEAYTSVIEITQQENYEIPKSMIPDDYGLSDNPGNGNFERAFELQGFFVFMSF